MLNYKHTDFFTHIFDVEYVDVSTHDFILTKFAGKHILHIGCVDSMYYNPNNNLHIKLSKISKSLHGYDIDIDGLNKLNCDCPSTYYTNINDVINNKYDVVLIPEVIEHVLNLHEFIESIKKINTTEYFITAPDISLYKTNITESSNSVCEIVHPDHKYWFSPYTLYKSCSPLIEKITSTDTCNMYNIKGSIAIHIK